MALISKNVGNSILVQMKTLNDKLALKLPVNK